MAERAGDDVFASGVCAAAIFSEQGETLFACSRRDTTWHRMGDSGDRVAFCPEHASWADGEAVASNATTADVPGVAGDMRNEAEKRAGDTMKRRRRSVAVEAVRCGRDNADEVNAFLKRNGSPFKYSPNPHGGWQMLYTTNFQDYRRKQVWIDSWLVALPEVAIDGGVVNIQADKFEELYR